MTAIQEKRTALFLLALISSGWAVSLPEDYDHSIRPNNGGVGDVVNVSVQIIAIQNGNDNQQSISVDLLLRTFWVDSRLTDVVERDTIFVGQAPPQVWIPQISIVNSRDSKYSDRSLKLKSDGTLDSVERVSAQLNCHLSALKYPFGRQTCQIQLNSNGYTTIHLLLIWHGYISKEIPTFDPNYKFLTLDQSSGRQKTEWGEYSYLYVDLTMSRCPLRVVSCAILPCLLFAALSFYVTFFMGVDVEEKVDLNSKNEDEDPNHKENPNAGELSWKKIYFDIVRVSVNALLILLIVTVGEINSLKSPRSGTITGLDVWTGMMGLVVIVCLLLSLRISSNVTEEGRKTTGKVIDILKFSIPLVFSVFLISYLAFCLS